MPNIIINSLTDVTIDGVSSGGVVDALFHAVHTGDEALRAPMLDALADFVRDGLKSATDDLTEKHAKEIAGKDAAHEATIAHLKDEHERATKDAADAAKADLDSQKIASDTAAAATKETADAAIFALKAEIEKVKTTTADELSKANDALKLAKDDRAADAAEHESDYAALKKERDDLAAEIETAKGQLSQMASIQAQLSALGRERMTVLYESLKQATVAADGVSDVVEQANKTNDQRAADEKAKRIAALQAQLDAETGT